MIGKSIVVYTTVLLMYMHACIDLKLNLAMET